MLFLDVKFEFDGPWPGTRHSELEEGVSYLGINGSTVTFYAIGGGQGISLIRVDSKHTVKQLGKAINKRYRRLRKRLCMFTDIA